jgi:hypothetical protein
MPGAGNICSLCSPNYSVHFLFSDISVHLASPSSSSRIRGIPRFFCSSKRNEPKKKSPEMPTSAFLGARYTSLIGATKKAAVRTISGFAPVPLFRKFRK